LLVNRFASGVLLSTLCGRPKSSITSSRMTTIG
jgi:hypothetical protein